MFGRRKELERVEEKWLSYQDKMWSVGLDYYSKRIEALGGEFRRVLDLGCGPGQWSIAAAEKGSYVVGCDLRISQTIKRIRKDYPKFNLVQASAENLPFRRNSFDLVLCELVLPYVNVEESLREALYVLRPNGIFHATCHGPGYYLMQAFAEFGKFDRNSVRRILVLLYTMLHRFCCLANYHYETFQSGSFMKRIMRRTKFTVIECRKGGHPFMLKNRFLWLPTFFEIVGRKEA